jgi:trimeric autotransporter adhesin
MGTFLGLLVGWAAMNTKNMIVLFGLLANLNLLADPCRARKVGNFFPKTSPVVYRNSLYFEAWDTDLEKRRFLKFDGHKAQDVAGENADLVDYPGEFVVYHDQLYFAAVHPKMGRQLWRFNGTKAEVVQGMGRKTFAPSFPVVFNDSLYFRGTGPQNYLFYRYAEGGAISEVEGISYPGVSTPYKNKLLLNGSRAPGETGLFSYDGKSFELLFPTLGYTSPIATLPANEDFYFIGADASFLASKGFLYSYGKEGLKQRGNAEAPIFQKLIRYQKSLFYRGIDGALYRYDGKQEVGIASSFETGAPIVYDGRLYFSASDAAHNNELFVYDGKTVSFLLQVNPHQDNSRPADFFKFKDELYFSAWSEGSKRVLWKVACEGP